MMHKTKNRDTNWWQTLEAIWRPSITLPFSFRPVEVDVPCASAALICSTVVVRCPSLRVRLLPCCCRPFPLHHPLISIDSFLRFDKWIYVLFMLLFCVRRLSFYCWPRCCCFVAAVFLLKFCTLFCSGHRFAISSAIAVPLLLVCCWYVLRFFTIALLLSSLSRCAVRDNWYPLFLATLLDLICSYCVCLWVFFPWCSWWSMNWFVVLSHSFLILLVAAFCFLKIPGKSLRGY